MKKHLVFLATFVFMFLLVSFWITAEETGNNPVAVSPGSETEVVTVWQSCPTFSWSSVDQAASYRIAVFESVDGRISPYEGMAVMSAPMISKQIPGPALSWTLSSEERLKTGSMYAWYVQALDASGNAIGSWSGGRIFKVEQEVRFVGIEEKLGEILKSYGVSEETAANVLNGLKSEVQEVVVRSGGAGSKNTPDLGVVQGTEGVNTLYGLNAGASITTGDGNTFIGHSAGYRNTSGYDNSFYGVNSGYNNTIGNHNTFIGVAAGNANTTANNNTFLGRFAGAYNTTGDSNTFLGADSGYSNTTGVQNTFAGRASGLYNTTGYENAFIGFNAGYTNTTGYANTFFGNEAGKFNTTGSNNTFLGKAAGSSTTTGETNVFIGSAAGLSNTTGYQNVFVGRSAGNSNSTGNSNTFLGSNAGYNSTTGVYNTFLGYSAGNINSTGNNNTAIGFFAGFANSTGQGNVFLGYNSGYNETGSNKLYIANSDISSPLIYGEFDNSLLKINGNLRVTGYLSLDNGATQINSTEINLLHGKTSVSTGSTDNDKLVTKGYVDENDDVDSGLTGSDMSDTYICKWDDANTRLVDSLISESPGVIKINGKLGIGTSTPSYPLELNTTGEAAELIVKRTDGASGVISAGATHVFIGAKSNHDFRLTANDSVKMTILPSGNVGIGTTAPSYPLQMASGAYCSVGGTWTNTSSRALKENIENLSADEAVAALTKLNPVKYNYKVDKTDKHVGFIAEDVPELVATTDRKGLSPMDVTAVLTKVVQELRKENQEYKKIISDLQERVATLEKK